MKLIYILIFFVFNEMFLGLLFYLGDKRTGGHGDAGTWGHGDKDHAFNFFCKDFIKPVNMLIM